jgi:hypothetical protein
MTPVFVIAQSGRGQAFQRLSSSWIPAFAGMTIIYEASKYRL